jgi:hypothetical protein
MLILISHPNKCTCIYQAIVDQLPSDLLRQMSGRRQDRQDRQTYQGEVTLNVLT